MDPVFARQIWPNSVPQFVKFREIPQHYYPQMPYIPQPVGVVDNTSEYKEFIVTCNTRKHIKLGHSRWKYCHKFVIIIIKVSLQWLDFIVL